MLLAARVEFSVELPEIGERIRATSLTKHSAWWKLVKKLSQHDPEQRKRLLETIGMQLGLEKDWNAKYREDPVLSRRFLLLSEAEVKQLAVSGASVGIAHSLSSNAVAIIDGGGVERNF